MRGGGVQQFLLPLILTDHAADCGGTLSCGDLLKEIVAHLRSMSPLYEDFIKKQQKNA